MPEDYSHIVRRVHEEWPSLLHHNSESSCGEFLQRVVHAINQELHPSDHVGLLTKPNPGQPVPNGITLPNGVKVAVDIIAFQNGERVDVISAAGAHPKPAGPSWNVIAQFHPETGENQWRDSDRFVNIDGWPIWNSDAPDEVVVARAELGRGWFPLIRGLMDWPDEVNRNWIDLMREEQPDYFRIMLAVEGLYHVREGARDHGMPDPWAHAAVIISDPRYDDTFRRMCDMLGNAGVQGWFTVYGGRYQTQTPEERARFHDRIVRLLDGYWPVVRGFEMMNEYRVNGWSETEVIEAGRDLQSKVPPGTVLALSSPDAAHNGEPSKEQMLEAMKSLYGHGVGNRMTIHRNRDERSRWYDLFAYNGLMPELDKDDNEPPGQSASAGGDVSDPRKLVEQYQRASEAGWTGQVAHNAWCVFNGHMPAVWLNRLSSDHSQRFIMDVTNQKAVSNGLREYRRSGTVVVPHPPSQPHPPGREGEEKVQPYPDENTWWQEYAQEVIALWKKAGRHDLVALLEKDPRALIWFSRMGHSSCHRKDLQQAREGHLQELANELGVSR